MVFARSEWFEGWQTGSKNRGLGIVTYHKGFDANYANRFRSQL